ncbi:MAG: hypothetical protein MPK09_07310 [Gammaproteobacteria bacterium]|nr:hypothetical protein [Gammaproteobacteria bacterium]
MLDIKIPSDLGQKVFFWLKVAALACLVLILLHLYLQMVELEFACDAAVPIRNHVSSQLENAACYWNVLWGGRR